MKKGFFIVFEGPDGCGKSTQANLLYRELTLEGYPCIVTEEPGGTPEGKRIREVLLDPYLKVCPKAELFLFLADRSEHVNRIVQPSLNEGKIVICSRYFYSTLVYQGIVRDVAPLEFLKSLNLYAVDGITPDIVFYLDVSAERGLSQARDSSYKIFKYTRGDRIESEGVSFQKRVREGYLEISSHYRDSFVIIKDSRDIEGIRKLVYEHTKRRLKDD